MHVLNAIPVPTGVSALSALKLDEANSPLDLTLPAANNQHPDIFTVRLLAQLLQSHGKLRSLRFQSSSAHTSDTPQQSPRNFARGGLWASLASAGIEVEANPTTTAHDDASSWDPSILPPEHQPSLFGDELVWRRTLASDDNRRLEYRVGLLDRPDARLDSFDTPDELAARISHEILDVMVGGTRRASNEDSNHVSRLLARATATLIENVQHHAFDYASLDDDLSIATLGRKPLSSLLVSITRGGGSTTSTARQSDNRIYVIVHDNGISIPTSVRNHRRFGGVTDSAEILSALLANSLSGGGREQLRGLGYPELLELAEASVSRGWSVEVQVATQLEDIVGDTIIASRSIGPDLDQAAPPTVVENLPILGTTVVLTIKIPGQPDWLAAD